MLTIAAQTANLIHIRVTFIVVTRYIYLRFELETQVESMLVYLSFDLYIFALSSVFN